MMDEQGVNEPFTHAACVCDESRQPMDAACVLAGWLAGWHAFRTRSGMPAASVFDAGREVVIDGFGEDNEGKDGDGYRRS